MSTAQSNVMAVKMAITIDKVNNDVNGCDVCSEDDQGNMVDCTATCTVSAFALVSLLSGVSTFSRLEHFTVPYSDPRDAPGLTEPDPPRFHKFS